MTPLFKSQKLELLSRKLGTIGLTLLGLWLLNMARQGVAAPSFGTFDLLMGSIFIVSALLVFYVAFRLWNNADRALQRMDQYPYQPWRWPDRWLSNQILSNETQVRLHNVTFTPATFTMEAFPATPGDALRGHLDIPSGLTTQLTGTLSCCRRTISSRFTHDDLLWKSSFDVPALPDSATGHSIAAIHVRLPDTAECTSLIFGQGGVFWKLDLFSNTTRPTRDRKN